MGIYGLLPEGESRCRTLCACKSLTSNRPRMSSKPIDEESLEEYKEAFVQFDKNKDGRVDLAELAALMRHMGHNLTGMEFNDLVKDCAGTTTVAQDAWIAYMGKRVADEFNSADVIEAFQAFDKDGKGMISISELRHILTNIGDKLDEQMVEEMLQRAVGSGDGNISYESFVNTMLSR